MTDSSILTVRKGDAATITLNRPSVLNALNTEMAENLLTALRDASGDSTVRAILLSAAGSGFCAGQDLAELTAAEAAGTPLELGPVVERYNQIVQAIVEAPKPVVCQVNGVAAGAGANLAFACDFVIAAERASFVQAFVKVGLIPDSGGTFFLPRLVGLAKARELAMLGEKISAAEASRLGLIYQVVADDELAATVETFVQKLASLPTLAIARIKKAFAFSLNNSLAEQLAVEKQLQVECAATADYAEGKQAFLGKRAPRYSGK
ncbi:MAG: enoyl-CoA hydratase-related protein [Bdellovibrionota bacterium]